MRKRTRVALLLAAGVLVTLGLLITFPGSEPKYEGKPLAYWIEPFKGESTPEQAHANIAIHALCAGRVPALLADMEYDPLPRIAKWRNVMQRLPRFLRTSALARLALADPRAERAYVAQLALRALGQDDPRVSIGLSRLMQSTNFVVSFRACWTMSYLGTNGLAWLVRVASQTTNTVARVQALDHMAHLTYLGTNAIPAISILATSARETNFAVARFAVIALGQLRLQPEISTAALQAALGNPDLRCRREALISLRAFGSAAIPALTNALADPDPLTQKEAASVLELIAPTTFTNAAVH